ncbi:MAG TPA: hypothetical protein VFX70_05725 [Mycobacteriales bacterium]|nr:hypothetical protein [Mycobacteriales bacterium]
MDPFHQRLIRVSLPAADQYGFCLAGGYAVAAHGFTDRLSEDVDLFSTMAAERDFPAAVEAVVTALKGDGLDVTISRQGGTFARLKVTDPSTEVTSTSNWAWIGVPTRRPGWRSARCSTLMTPWPTRRVPCSVGERCATTSTWRACCGPAGTPWTN